MGLTAARVGRPRSAAALVVGVVATLDTSSSTDSSFPCRAVDAKEEGFSRERREELLMGAAVSRRFTPPRGRGVDTIGLVSEKTRRLERDADLRGGTCSLLTLPPGEVLAWLKSSSYSEGEYAGAGVLVLRAL